MYPSHLSRNVSSIMCSWCTVSWRESGLNLNAIVRCTELLVLNVMTCIFWQLCQRVGQEAGELSGLVWRDWPQGMFLDFFPVKKKRKKYSLHESSCNFLFYHAGIQLQTHSKICVVLFAESRGWKTMATTYQRQSKGKCYSKQQRSCKFTASSTGPHGCMHDDTASHCAVLINQMASLDLRSCPSQCDREPPS